MLTVDKLLQRRLIICVGTGGVGKTTTAAALAAAAARLRRRSAVITVDPARRLKDALGLGGLSVDPQRVTLPSGARFDALALEGKRTFDALIERFAPNADVAARIRGNRLYQEISNEFAGSAEYMAMEKLHELLHADRYQTVIVDTPPSAHARELLTAPARLSGLLGSRAVKLLQAPSSLLTGVSSVGRVALSALLNALERWTGAELLQDLSEFVSGFEHMIEGFQSRAEEVTRLLYDRQTAFVLVTAPEPHTIETTIRFHQELTEGGYPVAGVIANRVLALPRVDDVAAHLLRWREPLRGKLERNYLELRAIAQRHRAALQRLHHETRAPLLAAVPAVVEAPTTLAGLERFARHFDG